VLILEDGNRVGGLGFESGDHAEPVDVLSVERIEVVKGPATLLYGSNAIGGVVNTISGHDSAHPGFNGYVTGVGSSNNRQGGGSVGLEYGTKRWLIWGGGGGQRAGDYSTPIGRVPNSFSREGSFSSGFGFYPDKGFISFNYTFNKRRYGIPFDPNEADPEVVFLNPRRQSFEMRGGFRQRKSFLEAGTFSVQFNNYRHSEIDADTGLANTSFKNDSWLFNGTFDQQKRGRWSGRFGFWGQHRDFEAIGDEALAPPTKQNSIAVFGLQNLDFERVGLQFGARVENNSYSPTETIQHGVLPNRSFTGFSGALGVRIPTWTNGAITANYSHSYRAPSLEELYNNGPHPGNLAFEIGDPNLKRELGDGLDFGVRHSSKRLRAEANGFFYNIRDFVFLAPTGAVDADSDLVVAEYRQDKARFVGMEARTDVALHPAVWLNLGMDYVRAELTETNSPSPRIPPFRGRVGFEFRYKGLLLNPELVMAKDQDRLFQTEERTPGYSVFGLSGSYLFATQHAAHIISFNAFNLGDRLYRNHLSFIKDFAPEMGRGLRVTYTLRFY
jgi:iron complex outermembrane recepter protein